MPYGSAPRAATVASSTPPASPRQPACAAATAEPSRAAKSTGRQSATWIAQIWHGARVSAASARIAAYAREMSAMPDASESAAGAPGVDEPALSVPAVGEADA